MKIKGAIFDFDGTLFDSMFIWDTIGEDYLKYKGIKPKKGLNELFKNMTLLEASQYYQNEYKLNKTSEEIMDEINNLIKDYYAYKINLKDGTLELLEEFQQMGIKMAIATATDRHLIEIALKKKNILTYFEEIFTCTEIGFGKTKPYIYEKALKILGTPKKETLVFEDALHAIKTAKIAGFKVVGVYDLSFKLEQNEIKALSDIYLKSFTEWKKVYN